MDPYPSNYLEKMLPGFEKKPKEQTFTPPPAPSKPPATEAKTPAMDMLTAIVAFLRRYLVCDEHQLTIIAIWIVHTWCYDVFTTSAYLDIRSPESQSGKSLLLDLLELLCDSPERINGGETRTIWYMLIGDGRDTAPQKNKDKDKNKKEEPSSATLFFDDCHHTFGPSERQPLLAWFNSGSRRRSVYTFGGEQYSFFCPKVFAGNAHLPRSLAVRCIPILLRRKRPADAVARFDFRTACDETIKLRPQIEQWAKDNTQALENAARNTPDKLPLCLSAREQDCAEPLLHIANRIGGPWPEKTRAAILALLQLSSASTAVELLSDIRLVFAFKENPEHLTTADLESILARLDFRPWGAWRGFGHKLAFLLHPFGIKSRNLKIEKDKVLKGYLFKDFHDTWERYLPPFTEGSATKTANATSSAT